MALLTNNMGMSLIFIAPDSQEVTWTFRQNSGEPTVENSGLDHTITVPYIFFRDAIEGIHNWSDTIRKVIEIRYDPDNIPDLPSYVKDQFSISPSGELEWEFQGTMSAGGNFRASYDPVANTLRSQVRQLTLWSWNVHLFFLWRVNLFLEIINKTWPLQVY